MTDQHDARDETAELLAWFTEADGFNQGTKAPHKWVLRAEQELRRLAATQPTKPEQQAGGVPAGWAAWENSEGWGSLAWELCADENGEESCNELIWEGGPVPEPWDERWLKYEDEAKRLIKLAHKHAAAPSQSAVQPLSEAQRKPLTDKQIEKLRDDTFSINNPFCPVDSKSMRKAVRAAERAHGIVTKEGPDAN